jgi:hypothetical protein
MKSRSRNVIEIEKQFGMEVPVIYEMISVDADDLYDADEQVVEDMKLRLRDARGDE